MTQPAIDWNDPEILVIRRDMLRFAQLQLRDAALAEDMVQDAFVAAMGAADSFAGRATLKTWMFAILRNKIIDRLRRGQREINSSDLGTNEDCDCEHDVDQYFNRRMLWQTGLWTPEHQPRAWEDPEAAFDQRAFWEVFEACVRVLPSRSAQIFMMREFLEFETDEICAQLEISSGNCWVILHRARTALRGCLERRWFDGEVTT